MLVLEGSFRQHNREKDPPVAAALGRFAARPSKRSGSDDVTDPLRLETAAYADHASLD